MNENYYLMGLAENRYGERRMLCHPGPPGKIALEGVPEPVEVWDLKLASAGLQVVGKTEYKYMIGGFWWRLLDTERI